MAYDLKEVVANKNQDLQKDTECVQDVEPL